jgi:hypothetical protein
LTSTIAITSKVMQRLLPPYLRWQRSMQHFNGPQIV